MDLCHCPIAASLVHRVRFYAGKLQNFSPVSPYGIRLRGFLDGLYLDHTLLSAAPKEPVFLASSASQRQHQHLKCVALFHWLNEDLISFCCIYWQASRDQPDIVLWRFAFLEFVLCMRGWLVIINKSVLFV